MVNWMGEFKIHWWCEIFYFAYISNRKNTSVAMPKTKKTKMLLNNVKNCCHHHSHKHTKLSKLQQITYVLIDAIKVSKAIFVFVVRKKNQAIKNNLADWQTCTYEIFILNSNRSGKTHMYMLAFYIMLKKKNERIKSQL